MDDAPQEVRDEIKRLAQEGKIEFAGDVTKINMADPDFTIENVELVAAHGPRGDCLL